jgi:hypothetical protein
LKASIPSPQQINLRACQQITTQSIILEVGFFVEAEWLTDFGLQQQSDMKQMKKVAGAGLLKK